MVVPKGMIRGLNGDLMQQMATSRNRCFGSFPETDLGSILRPPPLPDLHDMIGWPNLEKVSRESQKSPLEDFGFKEWEDRLRLPKTFGGENFIQDSRINQHGGAKDDCDLQYG
jgi:hypothetical protein